MKKDVPRFNSLEKEREFWENHNPLTVKSIYTASVGEKGVFICLPKDMLSAIDVKTGGKIKSWTEGKRLVIEAA